MKGIRTAKATLMAGIAAIGLVVSAEDAVDTSNRVVNGDFERGMDAAGQATGWNSFPKNFKAVANAGENGSTGLVYENDDPNFYAFPIQSIEVEPGALYEVSARVMSERLSNPAGMTGGINLLVECIDKDGRYLEAVSAHPAGHTDGAWQTISGIGKVPENAVKMTVSPYVQRGFVGKVHYDSISVRRMVRKPLIGLYSSAYRDCVAEGTVEFVAGIDLKLAARKTTDFTPMFAIPGRGGKIRRVPPTTYDAGQARVTVNVASLPMGRFAVGFELRDAKTGVSEKSNRARLMMERVAKLPARTVWFDAKNRLIVDGKPFFPLGMYWSEKVTEAELDVFCQGPFNCVMNYNTLDEAAMDAYHRRGLKVCYGLSGAFADGKSFSCESNALNYVADKVRRFKDHPALLAWYVNDERGLDYLPTLFARQKYFRQADPNHPTWAVMYQVAILKQYVDTCDAIGTDPYPIGNSDRLALVADWTEAARDTSYGIRPVWQVPQAFDWGLCWKDKNDKTRYPSTAELKNMFWQTIACGANGIIAYNYSHLRDMAWKTPRDETWARTREAGEEIKRFIPVFLLGGEPPKVTCDAPALRVRAWREETGGAKAAAYVLVVNVTREAARGRLTIGGHWGSSEARLGGGLVREGEGWLAQLPAMGTTLVRLNGE